MHAPVLVQQFMHPVCIPVTLASSENYPCLSYLLWKVLDKTKNTTREKDWIYTDKGNHSEIRSEGK